MKLAAIDIGSNAARLLITDVSKTQKGVQLIKSNLIRIPLRLGFDVFESGIISTVKTEKLLKTILSYKYLMDIYDVVGYKACATSAMRDAANGKEIIQQIKIQTGIEIELISGDKEAALIHENHVAEYLNNQNGYLYIDVGGGSTELTFYNEGKMIFKQSYNIGTIRLLKQQVNVHDWDEIKNYIKLHTKNCKNLVGIGSGGNINKIFSLSKRKEGKPLSLEFLKDSYSEMSKLTVNERMQLYKLREDRADVLVPALLIYINVLKWAGATEIYVPKIGLADGLIHQLYDELNP